MKITRIASVAALLLSSAFAVADGHTASDKPSFQATQTETITATVEAINHETREVSLRRPDGEIVTFTASVEARNLDQVSVGDIVVAQYVETMTIKVLASDGMEAGAAGLTTVARTEKGEMPGLVAADTEVIVSTVEEINLEANTFKLKGPDGTVKEFAARNPENLRRSAVGDIVVMTFSHAVAISVEPGPAE